jgi:hypothetical protein
MCQEKYEEFYPWWEENWELGVPTWHKGKVTYEQWREANYGIKRLQGMIKFMKSDDWSNRLPETQEYLEALDKSRGTDFYETFPEMAAIFSDLPEE